MKWFLILLAVAIVCNFAAGDPLNLRGDYLTARQFVLNVATDIEHGGYQQLVHSSMTKK